MTVKQLTEGVWVIEGAVNMGLAAVDGGLVAIDTGLDKSAAKTLRKAAQELSQPLVAIINTHAHADHYGGNADLLQRFELAVYAPIGEAAVMGRPLFEPEYLWQGAKPLPGMNSKFLQAPPSRVDVVFAPDAQWQIGGIGFCAIPLFGHAHGQVGILVHDVLFAADSYFDAAVVDKHGIPYFVDWQQTHDSAGSVPSVAATWWVPGHGVATREPGVPVSYYRDRLENIYEQTVASVLRGEKGLDEIVAEVCTAFAIQPSSAGPYVLVRTPIAACLTAAVEAGRVTVAVDGARLLFHASDG